MSPTSTLPDWLERALAALQTGDTEGYMAMYAPEAVHEFPFAPDGGVRRLEGRAAITAFMQHLPSMIRFGSLTDVRVRQAGDEFIVEATGHHRRIEDDAPRVLDYVWFIRVQSGLVTHLRDYMNPLQLSAL